MNILELQNVSYVYGADTPFETSALKDINIGFEKGKITGVIGHTGSGKSTLVQLLNGLIKPASGKVLLDGEDIWENPSEISKVRYKVGLVMQYPEYQLFDETVRRDIGFAPRNMGLSEEECEKRVIMAADSVSLERELLDKSPFELSGGQKRRAAIAGVLAMQPQVLVLDEPAAGLDPRGRRAILGSMREYINKFGATIILVSHSMEDMAQYCDNIVVMNSGEIFMTGSVAEVFRETERICSVGLDVPQISYIVSKLRRDGICLEGDLYTVESVRDAILRAMKERRPE